ncbi:MAG: C45 family autoproteolytic acyltransferase/hydrolase, partial [Anaerolineales bacterium]|nr:C45 family autoproteolytic acyltransferase/hydrolase [Anaerolineales bacterium]
PLKEGETAAYLQGSLVSMDPTTGYVRAMVGGRDFNESRFNRAVQAKRQSGSAFKPFVYAAALEAGYSPASVITGLNDPTLTAQGDWVPEDEGDVFIVHVTPKSEPPFLAMTYGGLLPNIGINAYGITQLCDSVYPNDSRIGIPRTVNSRAVLAAKTPSEAINHMLAPRRAAGYNHLLVHESGEMYNVEVSARRFAILYGEDGYLAHTNNYLAENMTVIEDEPEELVSSRVRYFRAMGLLKRIPQHTLKSLQAIQRDHVNFPNSICNHSIDDQNPLDREKTINAMVIDLTVREIHIAWGNPCENPYHTYHLDA